MRGRTWVGLVLCPVLISSTSWAAQRLQLESDRAAPEISTLDAYADCGGSCSNLALGKTVTASGLWDASGNPAEKVNDGNTGTNPACEGATGYCAIASTPNRAQAVGNFLQIDLGGIMSVKSVTVYGRRDFAQTQGQNLYLKTSTDGTSWTSTYMADTTGSSGTTVTTATLARYVKVETSTVVYLSLYEIVVTGSAYVDCAGTCTNLALGRTVTASGLWDASGNPAEKVNDGNTGADPACEGATGYCAIASTPNRAQAVGNFLQIDLGGIRSVKSVTVYGRRDFAIQQGQNLDLKLSTDGVSWTTFFMADTTASAGLQVSTARLARYVQVVTKTVNYLSLYEIVVTGSAASGTVAPPAGPQSNPCVPNVPAAFAAIRHYGDTLRLNQNNLAPDYDDQLSSQHFQGIQRLRAPGNYLALSGVDPGEVFIGVMGSRNPTPGSPWSTNYYGSLANDKLIAAHDTGAHHVGGLSAIGDYLAMPLQDLDSGPDTQVGFLDVTNPASPVQLAGVVATLPSRTNLGAVGITKLQSGKFLLGAHDSTSPQTLDWYLSTGTDLTTTGWAYRSTNVLGSGYENVNLVNQCDGHVYMIATRDRAACLGWCGDDRRMDLYDVAMANESVTNVGLVAEAQMQCGTDGCEFAAAAGTYVTPNGTFLAYSSRPWLYGDILHFVEFQQIPAPVPVTSVNDAYAMYWKDAGMSPDVRSMATFFYDSTFWTLNSMDEGFGYSSLDAQISSIVYSIPSTYELVLREGSNGTGNVLLRLSGAGTYPNLAGNGLNDRIRSASLVPKNNFIEIFDGTNFTAPFQTNLPFTAGAQYADLSNTFLGENLNNKISSIRFRGGPSVTCFFYHDVNFVNQCGTAGNTNGGVVEVPVMSTTHPSTMKCANNQISSYRCARVIGLE